MLTAASPTPRTQIAAAITFRRMIIHLSELGKTARTGPAALHDSRGTPSLVRANTVRDKKEPSAHPLVVITRLHYTTRRPRQQTATSGTATFPLFWERKEQPMTNPLELIVHIDHATEAQKEQALESIIEMLPDFSSEFLVELSLQLSLQHVLVSSPLALAVPEGDTCVHSPAS